MTGTKIIHRQYHLCCNKKSAVVMLLFVFFIVMSAWACYDEVIPTGPYVLAYPANFGKRINFQADNPMTMQGVYLGRLLFYENGLSANHKLSCGSCHMQQKAFTDGNAFSKGVDHVLSSRNAMSLANLLWARKFF